MQARRRARRERPGRGCATNTFFDHRLRDVVGVLFAQNVKIRYRGSALGIAWSRA